MSKPRKKPSQVYRIPLRGWYGTRENEIDSWRAQQERKCHEKSDERKLYVEKKYMKRIEINWPGKKRGEKEKLNKKRRLREVPDVKG